MAITLQTWEQTTQRFQHQAQAVAFHAAGRGRALLLLHGFPTSSFDYAGQWEGLSAHHFVMAFDMLGYGLSDKPADYAYSIADQADIAEELCAQLGVQRCQVLCQDVGNTVCQELLARQLEGGSAITLERVLLLNGGLFPETHRATPLQQALLGPNAQEVLPLVTRESFRDGLKSLFGPTTIPDAETLEAMWTLLERAQGVERWPQLIRYIEERKTHRERWVRALVDSPVPLRLIDGALDPVSGRHMAERYRELIPNPAIDILDHVGHFPQLEVPEYVLEQALRYFDDAPYV